MYPAQQEAEQCQDPTTADAREHGDTAAKLVEQCCWTSTLLVPLLYYLQGPAVSADQAVARILVTTLALVGAIGCRIRAWKSNWKPRRLLTRTRCRVRPRET